MSEAEIEAARLRSARARAKLGEALLALKERLLPRTIARHLLQATKDKATDAATAGADAVKARPGVAVGVAALAALFLARKPIVRAISHDDDETPPPSARSTAKRPATTSVRPARKPTRKGQS